jgi:hypothetical protein
MQQRNAEEVSSLILWPLVALIFREVDRMSLTLVSAPADEVACRFRGLETQFSQLVSLSPVSPGVSRVGILYYFYFIQLSTYHKHARRQKCMTNGAEGGNDPSLVANSAGMPSVGCFGAV